MKENDAILFMALHADLDKIANATTPAQIEDALYSIDTAHVLIDLLTEKYRRIEIAQILHLIARFTADGMRLEDAAVKALTIIDA